jgi:hypothetical protein
MLGVVHRLVVCVLVMWALHGRAAAQSTTPLIDKTITVGAGATLIVAAGDALTSAEDQIVPNRLLEEHGPLRRAANITYRMFEVSLLDLAQARLLLVANHEIFGHGGRLRERFDGPISYHIDAPPPYGDGGGETSFEFDRKPSVHELLAITVGGMEANTVAADLLAMRAVRGRFTAREAMRYIGMRLDSTSYVLETGDTPEEAGHDVSDFIQTYNELARAANEPPLTPRTLRHEVVVSLADPVLAYSYYALVKYIAVGQMDMRVPMLRIGGVQYLPALRYALTPFGTEWAVTNHFVLGDRVARVDVRVGRSVGHSPWGLLVRQSNVATWRDWRLDVAGDLWRQPPLALDANTPIDLNLQWGGEIRGRASHPFARAWRRPIDVTIEGGAKTNGFSAGEPLGGGALVRIGVTVPLATK